MINLYDHQKKALDETKDKDKCAFYLDMGLGKTITAIEKLKMNGTKHNVVICPKSQINMWVEELSKYTNLTLYKPNQSLTWASADEGTLIINYDSVWRRKEIASIETLILDESQMIKNRTSKRTKFITRLVPTHLILLSGTPCGGKYEDLYTQLKMLGLNMTQRAFWNHFVNWREINFGTGFPVKVVTGYKNETQLKALISSLGGVFMKTEEVIDLPKKRFLEVKLEPSSDFKKFHKNRVLDKFNLVGDSTMSQMLGERRLSGQYHQDKLQWIKDFDIDEPVVVFYNFRDEYELLKGIFESNGYVVETINGDEVSYSSTNAKKVVLCQYQTASTGHNLQFARYMIYFTPPLSCENWQQSQKRIHRIGQSHNCTYYKLIGSPLEEKIYKTIERGKDFEQKLFLENF